MIPINTNSALISISLVFGVYPMRLPAKPPKIADLLEGPGAAERLRRVLDAGELKPTKDGKYLHWDKLLHLDPPDGLSVEDLWMGMKMARLPMYRTIPLVDTQGRPFRFTLADP